MKKPLISIITPTYNHENYINSCIESVLSQSYTNWEQIIIDDGSNDATEFKIKKYNDERIKYIKQNNVGIWKLNKTYNRALKYSQGDLIAILEGDDYWPANKLETQIKLFEKKDVILSWGKSQMVDNNKNIIGVIPTNQKKYGLFNSEQILTRLLLKNIIPACTVICRKEALLNIGGFKQPKNIPTVDYPTWLELSLEGNYFFIDKILGYWRQHDSQITQIMRKSFLEINKYPIQFFNKLPKEAKSRLNVNYNQLVLSQQYKDGINYFNFGRVDLLEGNLQEARKNFKKALNKGALPIKIGAFLGINCIRFNVDIEWAAKFFNKPTFKNYN